MAINIAMVDVTVSKKSHDFTEREIQIIEVLLLNLAAHANAQVTKENMSFTPIEKKEDEFFAFQFAWQKSIEEGQYEELNSSIQRRYETAFKMCNLEDVEIYFLENAYLNN